MDRTPEALDGLNEPYRRQLEEFVDQQRADLAGCLDGLTEEQARRRLVASRTTLLGLVKHATFVERVWFDEAITCRSREELGLPPHPDASFVLTPKDTITSVRAAYEASCAASRAAAAEIDLDELLHGNRRGPLPLRWVYLHMIRELARHNGHADILREQLLEPPVAASHVRA
jgi:hypothetical protein